MTQEEIENLKKEIEMLEIDEKNKKELNKLKSKRKKLQFRKKYSKLLNVTGGLEQGARRMFGSLGSGIKKVGKSLKKSDKWIEEQKAKERQIQKNSKSKNKAEDDWNWIG